MVEDGDFRHKIDFVTFFSEILNLEGHLNCITGSRVTAILLNWCILPIGGSSVVEALLSTRPTPSSFTMDDLKSSRSLIILVFVKELLLHWVS